MSNDVVPNCQKLSATSVVWLAADGALFRRMLEPFLRNLATLARAGHDVIAESMMTPDTEGLCSDGFRDLRVVFVGLECPRAVAQEREASRADRRKGPMNLDHPLLQTVHDHGCYDLCVDTSELTPRRMSPTPAAATPTRPR